MTNKKRPFESNEFDTGHHQPRSIDKKKHHRKGYSEDVDAKRHSRVNFKRYVRQLEEQLLDEELEDIDLK